ncbi:hypothetical protein BGZ83_001021 [Gryganskiella cystojenkinii]|nr:hypothetical protein BGZ83_001021 [Gryganskiella cystojenkinii]
MPMGYGPDYRPRRQSGGPGHLLFAFDAASSVDFESEGWDDSDTDEAISHSKHLQEQYLRMQKSLLRQSMLDNPVTASASGLLDGGSSVGAGTVAGPGSYDEEHPYLVKKGQRKSLGDELNVPPVPEKSSQRKRVSTMGAATLPAVSSAFTTALAAASNSATSASETLSSIIKSNAPVQPKDRRPQGSLGTDSLTFEPLYSLKDAATKPVKNEDMQLLSPHSFSEPVSSRHSAVSDADWITALKSMDPNQKDVAILDLSKRELSEIPAGLPTSISHLRLAYNSIHSILPIANLTSLVNLQVLDLCDNGLETLPVELGRLSRLKELHLSNNKLRKLPDAIQKMSSLEVLDIRNNDFYLLNPALGHLKCLKLLDVRNNKLKSLPAPLHMLACALTTLKVDGNQFVQPFSDLLQPLMDDSLSTATQSFLVDDSYTDSQRGTMRSVGGYEPWRRTSSAASPIPRRVPTLSKRRSHGDLMTMMGLQKKDSNGNGSVDDLGGSASDQLQTQKASTFSTTTGAYIAAAMSGSAPSGRRERSVSSSGLIPTTSDFHDEPPVPSLHSSSAGPLNRFFKSIRKGSRSSLRDNTGASKFDSSSNRHSVASEADPSVDGDQDLETKPNSKGSESAHSLSHGRRTPSSGINQWVRDRLHRRTNSNDLGISGGNGSGASLNLDAHDLEDGMTVRDSGYGGIGGLGSPLGGSSINVADSHVSSPGRGAGILGIRYQNKSTGHLPAGGSPLMSREMQFSSSFDPSRKDRNRFSYMSIESHLTEKDADMVELETAIARHQQQQLQQHRLSSLHSPTTPLPSSPVMTASHAQSTAYIKSLMRYLKDLNDLDPDSSEWEEVYAWRRVWNAERSTAGEAAGSRSKNDNEDENPVDDESAEAAADRAHKAEEIRRAKLQAQASRRRRIVDEIITTERTYVEGLKGLIEIYLTPALSVMPASDHRAVFSNAQAICSFHADHFLPELEKAYRVPDMTTVASPQSPLPQSSQVSSDTSSASSSSAAVQAANQGSSQESQGSDISALSNESSGDGVANTEKNNGDSSAKEASNDASMTTTNAVESIIKMAVEDRIGQVFATYVQYMKMYSFYINNFDNALRVLQTQLTQAKHKKKMKEFLRRCAKHPKHTQLALQGYLLLPVQRIPRYKLLLQDLLENTWRDHVDYQDIATALEKISDRADEMNERKRQYENHEKVLLVQSRILGQYKTPLVQPHRKVVREGMLHLIRVVTRTVSMAETLGGPSMSSRPLSSVGVLEMTTSVTPVGDMTVHSLSEELIEKSFLFILFNDIMIQCNPVTVSGGGKSSSMTAGAAMAGSSGSPSSSSNLGSGNGSMVGSSTDSATSKLELCRVLQLESRLHPAEVIGQDVLRVVDDDMVLYLTGDKDLVQSWKEDINSRW